MSQPQDFFVADFDKSLKNSIYLIHPRVCIKNVTTCYFYLMHENSILLAKSIRNDLVLASYVAACNKKSYLTKSQS